MKIGLAGTGRMGAAIAGRLEAVGHDVVVWNRTAATAEKLGLPVVRSPADLASQSETIITMLADGAAVRDVYAQFSGDLAGRPRGAFRYWDKGQLAVVGRGRAVADIWRFHFSGFIAWLTWIFVHIFFLIGFRNRVLVLIQWAWSYFTYGVGARIITEDVHLPPVRYPADCPPEEVAVSSR